MRVACIFLLTLIRLAAQSPSRYDGLLQVGLEAFRNSHFQESADAFQQAIRLRPNDPRGHLYLANTYIAEYVPGASPDETAEGAISELRRVLELDPNNTEALRNLGSFSFRRHNLEEARDWYRRWADVQPGAKEAYYSLAVIDWNEAYRARMAESVRLGLQPDMLGPLPTTAVRLALKAQYGQTIEHGIADLNEALALDPNYDDAMAYMNLLLRERASLRDSMTEYARDIASADSWLQKTLAAKKEHWGARTQSDLPPPPPPPPGRDDSGPAKRIRVGSAQSGKLIQKPDPVYPNAAIQARIQGTVRFRIIVDKEGRVASAELVSGHPLLVESALKAVKQYIYQPTRVNGEPVDIVTLVDVPFTLSQ
jgi:TonB family protein